MNDQIPAEELVASVVAYTTREGLSQLGAIQAAVRMTREAFLRPEPSREQVARALAAHAMGHQDYINGPDLAWQDWLPEARAVLALFEGGEAGREVTHDHKPVQHRDGKEPWCKVCGLNRNHEEPHSRLSAATPGGDS